MKPVRDQILIQVEEIKQESLIISVDNTPKMSNIAKVIAVSPKVTALQTKEKDLVIKKDDRIIFSPHAGEWIDEPKRLKVLSYQSVFGVLDD